MQDPLSPDLNIPGLLQPCRQQIWLCSVLPSIASNERELGRKTDVMNTQNTTIIYKQCDQKG